MEMFIQIETFSFHHINLKMSTAIFKKYGHGAKLLKGTCVYSTYTSFVGM